MNNNQNNDNDKLDMKSPDLVNQNFEKLAELFPNCVTESATGKAIDFDLLKQELSHAVVEGNKERYRLEWPGKREAIVTANIPTNKTLRPVREDSVDFDNTENIYIEGDNLEVLKLLQESYLNKIKMIYIDPPYNTGNDFVYKDNFAKDKDVELFESGQKDEINQRLVFNPENSGKYHSNWLSMMFSRLKLARNLLCPEGVIAIHIDENEYTNLEKLLSEIFGESNNLGTIIWDKRNPKREVAGVAQQHELISLYTKSVNDFAASDYFSRKKENADAMLSKVATLIKANGKVDEQVKSQFKQWIKERESILSGGEAAYSQIDSSGEVFQPVSMAAPDRPETRSHRPLSHPTTGKPCPVPAKGWRYPDATMDELLLQNKIVFGLDENTQPRRKYLLKENIRESVSSLLYFGGSDDALDLPFDNPKPLVVASRLIESICKPNEILIDFFAGSSTSAHSVMRLNAEDNSKRKYIMVQLPENCEEKSPAFKEGYQNICAIGKERIRRAAKKIKTETNADIDYGFRVYRLADSNMQDVFYRPQDYDQAKMDMFADNVKPDRTADDLLAQVMLDWGLPLSLKIEQFKVAGKQVFKVADNSLYACFDSGVDEEFAKEIAKDKPLRVVFKDNSFKDNSAKTNVKQLLKQLSPETEMKVI